MKLLHITTELHWHNIKTAVAVELSEYTKGGRAVILWNMESDEPYCVLSVWMPETIRLVPGTFFVKHWGGQEPIVQQLEAQQIIRKVTPETLAKSGFVTAYAYELVNDPAHN